MSTRSTLRRLPPPATEPPYDDELAPRRERLRLAQRGPAAQGTLALAFTLPSGLPAVPAPTLRLAAVPSEDPDFAAQATPRVQLPDPRPWAGFFIQALAEVVCGERPAGQLVRWTTPEVYLQLRAATDRGWPRGEAPVARLADARVVVRSVHVCEPRDGAAEVCATVVRGGRAAAVALRLEGRDGRWQCTAVQLG